MKKNVQAWNTTRLLNEKELKRHTTYKKIIKSGRQKGRERKEEKA